MTLLTLPTYGWSALDLEPDHLITVTKSRGGYTSEIRTADPTWAGSMATIPLKEVELRAWEAFIADATDRMLAFDFVHPSKRTPSAYSITTLPFSGDATISNIDDLRNPVMVGLPVGLVLRRGDRVSVTEDEYVSHRMVAADLTVASSVAQSVPITPRLPLGRFTTSAAATFKDPPMRLRVMNNTWTAPLRAGEAPIGSFQVYEAPR